MIYKIKWWFWVMTVPPIVFLNTIGWPADKIMVLVRNWNYREPKR